MNYARKSRGDYTPTPSPRAANLMNNPLSGFLRRNLRAMPSQVDRLAAKGLV